jgi:hypothetical protein
MIWARVTPSFLALVAALAAAACRSSVESAVPFAATSGSTGGTGDSATGIGGAAPCPAACTAPPCCLLDQRYEAQGFDGFGMRIAADPATGDVAVAGGYAGPMDVGAGPLPWSTSSKGGMFVARYRADGHARWTKGYLGGAGNGVVVFSGSDVLVAGALSGDVDLGCGTLHGTKNGRPFVMRLAGDGSCIWSKAFGGDHVVPLGAAIDGAGDVVVTGQALTSDPVDFGCGATPPLAGGFATKRKGSDGSCVWAHRIQGWGESVAVDASSSVYVAGSLFGSMPFAGTTISALSATMDALLLKYDAKGNEIWARHWGDAGTNSTAIAYGVAVTQDQRAWVSGSHDGSITFGGQTFGTEGNIAGFVFGVTADGAPVEGVSFDTGETGNLLQGPWIAAGQTGTLVVGGQFESNITVGGKALAVPTFGASFLAKLDPAHALAAEWALALEHTGVWIVGADRCGDVLAAGDFDGPPDLGCKQTSPKPGAGFFWGKLGP